MVEFRVRCLAVAFATILCSIIAGEAAAQSVGGSVPRVVRFDGVWTPDGRPAAAAETVTLSVYDAQVGGTPLWEETQVIAVDAAGRYAVLVGASRPEGLSPDLLASADPRWLEVRFARAAAPAPRVLLTSVPYALRAADADTLGGLPASAFLRAAPAEGVDGTTSGTDPAASTRAATPLVNTGTANYIGKFTNALDLTSSIMFETGGRIGVGTTAPLDSLHVAFTDGSGGVTGYAVQNLSGSANAYSGMLFYDQTGALGQFQGFNNTTHEYRINNIASGGSINFMLGGASRFLVRSDGDIQITGNLRKGADLWMHERGGGFNTALGREALAAITVNGSTNTAIGYQSMLSATNAASNVAVGRGTLRLATVSQQNTAVGYDALRTYDANYTVAIGAFAGADKVSGDRNIYVGYGTGGFANNTESNTIRIGDSNNGFGGNYSRFFAGGIRGVTTGASDAIPVFIDSNGQLGTANSSRRYKEDIQDMGDASSGLMRLRPVTYRYTQAYADGSKPLDYGLIAEEVEAVYPDLVAHLKGGEVETVQYQKINAMLLNEVQKQHHQIEALTARLAALERLLATSPR